MYNFVLEDFINAGGQLYNDQIVAAVNLAIGTPFCTDVTTDNNDVIIHFDDVLSPEQETILDGVVASWAPIEPIYIERRDAFGLNNAAKIYTKLHKSVELTTGFWESPVWDFVAGTEHSPYDVVGEIDMNTYIFPADGLYAVTIDIEADTECQVYISDSFGAVVEVKNMSGTYKGSYSRCEPRTYHELMTLDFCASADVTLDITLTVVCIYC